MAVDLDDETKRRYTKDWKPMYQPTRGTKGIADDTACGGQCEKMKMRIEETFNPSKRSWRRRWVKKEGGRGRKGLYREATRTREHRPLFRQPSEEQVK